MHEPIKQLLCMSIANTASLIDHPLAPVQQLHALHLCVPPHACDRPTHKVLPGDHPHSLTHTPHKSPRVITRLSSCGAPRPQGAARETSSSHLGKPRTSHAALPPSLHTSRSSHRQRHRPRHVWFLHVSFLPSIFFSCVPPAKGHVCSR